MELGFGCWFSRERVSETIMTQQSISTIPSRSDGQFIPQLLAFYALKSLRGQKYLLWDDEEDDDDDDDDTTRKSSRPFNWQKRSEGLKVKVNERKSMASGLVGLQKGSLGWQSPGEPKLKLITGRINELSESAYPKGIFSGPFGNKWRKRESGQRYRNTKSTVTHFDNTRFWCWKLAVGDSSWNFRPPTNENSFAKSIKNLSLATRW